MRFEAFLGLLPPWDLSLFSSRALHGAAHFLSWDCASVLCSVSSWGCPLSFVGLCLCFVQCFCMNSGGALFVARPRFVFLLGLLVAPLPPLVAFTSAFVL